jgi:hypothetical protein
MARHLPRTLVCWATLVSASSLAIAAGTETPQKPSKIVCSYAPSQSKTAMAISGATGGSAATTADLASALGLTVVTHSSRALILAGSDGYIAGTLGAAIAAPAVIAVGVVVDGSAITVELFCATKNHPEGCKKGVDSAKKFRSRVSTWIQEAKDSINNGAEKASSLGSVTLTLVKDKTSREFITARTNPISQHTTFFNDRIAAMPLS